MITQEPTGFFYISNNDTVSISLYGCIVFTAFNMAQNINLLIICSIKTNEFIVISTMTLIFVSLLSTILTWIIYYKYKILFIAIIEIIFTIQIITTFINKIFIVNYTDIKDIYLYVIYSHEFFAMFIIYILTESIISDTLINIIVMYIFVLTSMRAIQKHDQNNQDEQYFVMLSFLMLLPTLVIIAAPSIHILYVNTNISIN